MSFVQRLAFVYTVILLGAASLNYIPGLTDDQGLAFGIFELDFFDEGSIAAQEAANELAADIRSEVQRSLDDGEFSSVGEAVFNLGLYSVCHPATLAHRLKTVRSPGTFQFMHHGGHQSGA